MTIQEQEPQCRQDVPVRYYHIAGITIAVTADLPMTAQTFEDKFLPFAVSEPGHDVVRLHHHFAIPARAAAPGGQLLYRRPPWEIYQDGEMFLYRGILEDQPKTLYCYAEFDVAHNRGEIYHPDATLFRAGQWHALSLFSTDQIWLAHTLMDREARFLHAAGMIIDGHGMLFLGHSGAGKSTTLTMLRGHGELLCDDRIIVRRWPAGYRIHGTWSHGDLLDVSPADAPLRGLFFLEQSPDNAVIPLTDPAEVLRRLLLLVIRPAVTPAWWQRTIAWLETLVREVPAYRLQLNTSGEIAEVLHTFLQK